MIQQWWGVNEAVFTPGGPTADLGLNTRYVVGFAGRFTPEKGILDLAEAVAQLGPDYGLVLIGDGPQRVVLEQYIAALGLEELDSSLSRRKIRMGWQPIIGRWIFWYCRRERR